MMSANKESWFISSYCPWNLSGGSKEEQKKSLFRYSDQNLSGGSKEEQKNRYSGTPTKICPEEVRKSRKIVIQVLRPKFEGRVSGTHCNVIGLITYVRGCEIN
jgi:hypothetical protein